MHIKKYYTYVLSLEYSMKHNYKNISSLKYYNVNKSISVNYHYIIWLDFYNNKFINKIIRFYEIHNNI